MNNSTFVDSDLESELPVLRRLVGKIRPKLARWKADGIRELAEALTEKNVRPEWQKREHEPKDLIAYSLVKLLLARDLVHGLKKDDATVVEGKLKQFVKEQESTRINALVKTGDLGKLLLTGSCGSGTAEIECVVPMLQCARFIQAAFSNPSECTIDGGLLVANFAVLTELHSVSPPGWSMGSARSSVGAAPTAFVTGECTRARGFMVRSMLLSADLLKAVDRLLAKLIEIHEMRSAPVEWKRAEIRRLELSFGCTFAQLNRRSILSFHMPKFDARSTACKCASDVIAALMQGVESARKRWTDQTVVDMDGFLTKWMASSRAWMKSQTDDKTRCDNLRECEQEYQKAITGELALIQIQKPLNLLVEGMTSLYIRLGKAHGELNGGVGSPGPGSERLRAELAKLASCFNLVASEIRVINEPCERYFKSVLERELAARDTPNFNLGELVFAASSLSELEPFDYQQEIASACRVAIDRIAKHGIVSRMDGPLLASIESSQAIFVLSSEIIRAFTQLVANVGAEINVDVVENLVAYFESVAYPDPQSTSHRSSEANIIGWHQDVPNYPPKITRGCSALCLLALDKVCRMIDAFVNEKILKHFRVTRPSNIGLGLDDVLYGDFGLAGLPNDVRGTSCFKGNPEALQKSTSFLLESMRSHVLGVKLDGGKDACISMVLFGPPGTGKSTLPRAIAKSSGSPFVEITPGDLLAKGDSLFDYRTSSVFEALSYLRGCVVLFDEFDQIILNRGDEGKNENIFSFATGNNLTRLIDLHERFQAGRSAFILSTNRIGQLDNAAIRKGRFDAKIGVYNPDFVSTAGAIARKLAKYIKANTGLSTKEIDVLWSSYRKQINQAAGKPYGINLLAAMTPGNFKPWTNSIPADSFQACIVNSTGTVSDSIFSSRSDVEAYVLPRRRKSKSSGKKSSKPKARLVSVAKPAMAKPTQMAISERKQIDVLKRMNRNAASKAAQLAKRLENNDEVMDLLLDP